MDLTGRGHRISSNQHHVLRAAAQPGERAAAPQVMRGVSLHFYLLGGTFSFDRYTAGCLGLIIVIAGLIVLGIDWTYVTVGVILSFVALLGTIVLTAAAIARFTRVRVARRFRVAFGPTKDLLIVYTDSPHWAAYIEQNWLSRWGDRAVVLNRSRPWKADQPEAKLWRATTGWREHTPVAIVIPRDGRILVVRFFQAFRDHKHGHPKALRDAEERLVAALAGGAG